MQRIAGCNKGESKLAQSSELPLLACMRRQRSECSDRNKGQQNDLLEKSSHDRSLVATTSVDDIERLRGTKMFTSCGFLKAQRNCSVYQVRRLISKTATLQSTVLVVGKSVASCSARVATRDAAGKMQRRMNIK
jgi:hypothetical protein